jgi:hypothetical protein
MLWLDVLEQYTKHQRSGMPSLAIRYEDMKTAPHETLEKIFEYCDLPMMSMDTVYQVLERDSQAGSAISQERLSQKKNGLTDVQRADLVRALQPHPMIHTPDYFVPETWAPR